jgi:hypothetical protein
MILLFNKITRDVNIMKTIIVKYICISCENFFKQADVINRSFQMYLKTYNL